MIMTHPRLYGVHVWTCQHGALPMVCVGVISAHVGQMVGRHGATNRGALAP